MNEEKEVEIGQIGLELEENHDSAGFVRPSRAESADSVHADESIHERKMILALLQNYVIFKMKVFYEMNEFVKRMITARTQYKETQKTSQANQERTNLSSNWLSTILALTNYRDTKPVMTEEESKNIIELYWASDASKSTLIDETTSAVLILQHAFRMWLSLKEKRKERIAALKARAANRKNLQFNQSRQERKAHQDILKQQKLSDIKRKLNFQKFCKSLTEGITVDILSQTNGKISKRLIKFDGDYRNLVIGGKWRSKYYPLHKIYIVAKGLSERMYELARDVHHSWCLNLRCLDERVIDIQATDTDNARELYEGFSMMQSLLFTQASFYVDNLGVPRRAGPSIIRAAIDYIREEIDESEFKSN
jgi:hypothetical protein